MRTSVKLVMALLSGSLLAWAVSERAAAVGAVAFGSTGDVAKDGYSIGINANSSSEDDARKSAMDWCTSHGPKQTQAECEVVLIYHNQCAAEAQDPKAGTPGFGFALGESEDDAKKAAMAICNASAGKGRRQFCKVVASLCDK